MFTHFLVKFLFSSIFCSNSFSFRILYCILFSFLFFLANVTFSSYLKCQLQVYPNLLYIISFYVQLSNILNKYFLLFHLFLVQLLVYVSFLSIFFFGVVTPSFSRIFLNLVFLLYPCLAVIWLIEILRYSLLLTFLIKDSHYLFYEFVWLRKLSNIFPLIFFLIFFSKV